MTKPAPPRPLFFPTPADFRRWLAEHHASESELWVGFHKRGSGRPSLTWPESVDDALCHGWIDGVRKSLDADRYMIRFTPRKQASHWSAVNIGRMGELLAAGRVTPAGREAFERRTEKRSGRYSYEQRHQATLEPTAEERFRAEPGAWEYFQAQPPWYRKTATWWVVDARRPQTRERRLAQLIACSAAGRPLPGLDRTKKGAAAAQADSTAVGAAAAGSPATSPRPQRTAT
jgi:uncharacterized protein YdeI (YjbR/CyaY-like superfamily)